MSASPCRPPLGHCTSQTPDPLNTPCSHRSRLFSFQSPPFTSIQVVVKKPPPRLKSPIPVTYSVDMAEPQRAVRAKPRISYEISSDSDDVDSSSVTDSPFSSPKKGPKRRSPVVDLEDKDEDEDDGDESEEVEPEGTPPPRMSSAGHSLRHRSVLNQPLRARENGDHRRVSKQKKSKRSSGTSKRKRTVPTSTSQMTERAEIRHQISTVTAGKRANFFVAYKDLFFPLLPESNHIQRLVEQRQLSLQGEMDLSVPYKDIETQPAGYSTLGIIPKGLFADIS